MLGPFAKLSSCSFILLCRIVKLEYMSDLVSVIVPAYNSEAFISKTIDSILSQSHSNLELILIDDRSTDGTREIVEEYRRKDSRVKPIFFSVNQGAGKARNMGIKAAKGKYLAFVSMP